MRMIAAGWDVDRVMATSARPTAAASSFDYLINAVT
jgi:hypothetical protein